MTIASKAAALASDVAGAALGVGIGALAAVRSAKPLHPLGEVAQGVLTVDGTTHTGVALLDQPGQHRVLIRHSRAIGLPAPAPDIEGIALRIEGQGDLLFAGSGSGRWSRRSLALRCESGTCTTLLPLDGPKGSLDLQLDPLDEVTWALQVSADSGPWESVGVVTQGASRGDLPVRFDPVAHAVEGLAHYPAWQRVRAPAYAIARRLRPRPDTPVNDSDW